MDTDSFVFIENTNDVIKDLQNPKVLYDLSNLSEYHELFSSKKVIGKFRRETLKTNWMNEFIYFKSQAYSFKC